MRYSVRHTSATGDLFGSVVAVNEDDLLLIVSEYAAAATEGESITIRVLD